MKKQTSGIGLYLIIIGVILIGYYYFADRVSQESQFTYQEFEAALLADEIEQIDIMPNKGSDTGQVVLELSDGTEKQFYVTDVNEIEHLAREHGVKKTIVHDEPEDNTFLVTVMPMILMAILVVFLFTMMSRQMSGGTNSKMMNFGKSRAHLSTDADKKVTFKNVAGLDEEKKTW